MLACCLSEITLGSFLDNINDLFVKCFRLSYPHAGILLIIPFFGVAVLSLPVSILLGKWPTIRRSLYVTSSGLYLIGQVCLYLLP
jgi:fucose permease